MESNSSATTHYLALQEAHTAVQKTPENEEVRQKFAQAVVDVFLYHKGDLSALLRPEELENRKASLLKYLQQYLADQVRMNKLIELQLFSDPVKLNDWVKEYTKLEQNHSAGEYHEAKNMHESPFVGSVQPREITWQEHTSALDLQQDKINELQAKLQESQMGTMITPRGRRVNLGILDLKIPGKGDRTTRHYRKLQPLYAQYISGKQRMTRAAKLAALRDIISFASTVFPDSSSVVYWFQKGNFQTILDMSAKRRNKLEALIKQDESVGKLSTYKHNRLLARKAVFNIFNEALKELQQLLITDRWDAKTYNLNPEYRAAA